MKASASSNITALEHHGAGEFGRARRCLDPRGDALDSEAFAALLFDELDAGGSRLSLCVGPAEGFTEGLRRRARLVSLSRMTFTHQMARVLVAEQVYRASEIRRGSGYHK